ncbi:tol-pal system protein YbgF [Pseudomethylobacillus aquaticus]|uniref:Cell division coordinator CpoB n=1 Tax=Pseudomethylobacillus aquaticus TaxID=2676064 RepID=A0A3N0V2Y0_9PROT|nr:tol-pal system protein YbgF [Pseudomethylobacillus aquaticus]ROH87055.1 tol-pal system protein YbgF [Pseudomethylobacillus aquaticus]
MRFLVPGLQALVVIGGLVAGSAHAGLFSDDEARDKVNKLQQSVEAQNQANQATLSKLDKRLSDIEALVKGQGMLELLSQLEQLKQELSKVKGDLEVASHDVDLTQQRQRDLYADTDARLRKLEESGQAAQSAGGFVAVPVDGQPADAPASSAPPTTNTPVSAERADELKAYEAAQGLANAGRHREAFDAYDKFLQTYPSSPYRADAYYGLGFAQFSLKNYKAAISTQQKLLAQYPDSAKLPDALFNIANSQIQLADIGAAKVTLRELLARYPNSEVAPAAKRRLTALDAIKTR